jgi:hypothetical protein
MSEAKPARLREGALNLVPREMKVEHSQSLKSMSAEEVSIPRQSRGL